MKGKLYRILIPLYFVLCMFLCGGIVFSADAFPILGDEKAQYLLSFGLVVVGLGIGKIIHAVFHEICHIIPLKGKGAVILEFGLLGFYFRREGDAKRFGFKFSDIDGYVSFVTKNPEKCGIYVYSSIIIAGVGSVLSCVLTAILFRLVDNYFVFCLFGGGFVSSIYSLMVNFLTDMPSSDGAILYNAKTNFDNILAVCETQSRLYLGESLLEMKSDLFFGDENKVNLYYSYLKKLAIGDLDGAKNLLNILERENEKTFDNRPITLRLEKFFIAVLDSNVDYVEKEKTYLTWYADRNVDLQTLRIMAVYRKRFGDEAWANALKATFDKMENKALKGLYESEKQIINKFY